MEEIMLTEEDLEEVQLLVECDAARSGWGEDADFVEAWFAAGEEIGDERSDWIYWVDLYDERPNRSDLLVHWLRCLFDSALPRPAIRRLEPA